MANRVTKTAAGLCAAALLACALTWMGPADRLRERAAAEAVPNAGPATQTGLSSGDFVYALGIDGTVEITKYLGSAASVTVPATLDSFPVVSLKQAFMDNQTLESVQLPEGLTRISENAFTGCSALTAVALPDSVTTVERSAFYNCGALASVTFGSGLTEIQDYAFLNCASLGSVSLPDSVTALGRKAFSGCASLTGVTLSAGLQSAAGNAFSGCTALSRVAVPSQLGGAVLEGLVFDTAPTILCRSQDYAVTWANSRGYPLLFLDAPDLSRLETLTLPAFLTAIGDEAFSGVTAEAVVVPAGCGAIGSRAFAACPRLCAVVLPGALGNIADSAFADCGPLLILTPDGSAAAQWADSHGLPHQAP